MKKMYSCLLAFLLVSGSVLAGHPAGDWNEFSENILHMGFPVEQADRTIESCRTNGLAVEDAEALLGPVYTAYAERLPADCVLLKIEEGLTKRIVWEEIQIAADRRLDCLRSADALVLSVREVRGGQHQHLVIHTCMALESGLPREVFEQVFNRPGRFRYGRMIHVIEAGESLQLIGLKPEQTLQIMNDCLDRDLTGQEVTRLVSVLKTGLQDGKEFVELYATLWVADDSAGFAP